MCRIIYVTKIINWKVHYFDCHKPLPYINQKIFWNKWPVTSLLGHFYWQPVPSPHYNIIAGERWYSVPVPVLNCGQKEIQGGSLPQVKYFWDIKQSVTCTFFMGSLLLRWQRVHCDSISDVITEGVEQCGADLEPVLLSLVFICNSTHLAVPGQGPDTLPGPGNLSVGVTPAHLPAQTSRTSVNLHSTRDFSQSSQHQGL